MFSIWSSGSGSTPIPSPPPVYEKAEKPKARGNESDSLNIAPLDLAYKITLKNFQIHAQKKLEQSRSGSASKTLQAYEFVNAWYNDNFSALHVAATTVQPLNNNDVDPKVVGAVIREFNGTSKIVLDGLDALCLLHPFIKVAVDAFKNVLTLVPEKKDNRRVAWLKIQMRETMAVLFQLRHFKNPQEKAFDGFSIQDRLMGLVEKMAMDIEEMGSVCEAYQKKGFIAKIFHHQFWDERLSSYADVFNDNRRLLRLVFDNHAHIGSNDAAKPNLPLTREFYSASTIFVKLSTPKEDKTRKFIEEKGGGRICIENDQLLAEMIRLSGEGVAGVTLEHTGDRLKDLAAARRKLIKELEEDLDMELTRNLIIFRRKLEMLHGDFGTLFPEEDYVSLPLSTRPYDRVIDTDLRVLWKSLGWKGSVKARHFIVAVHDYFVDKFMSEQSTSHPHRHAEGSRLIRRHNDRWTLSYINIAYAQSILEALDDEALGLVTIKGVNTLFLARPGGWSLPQWIAYWAAGWHLSIDHYRRKIYQLIQRMMALSKNIHPSNQRYVHEYFTHDTFNRIELLLRSTKPASHDIRGDPQLMKLTGAYTDFEEERLEERLKGVAYEIDAVSTVSLLTGPGKIEKYIYPILYLLLKRDLSILQLARKNILDPDELWDRNLALWTLFSAFDERIKELTDVFRNRRKRRTIEEQLEDHACGMMHLFLTAPIPDAVHNTLCTWTNELDDDDYDDYDVASPLGNSAEAEDSPSDYGSDADSLDLNKKVSVDILKYRNRNELESTVYNFDCETFPESHIPTENSLEGAWAGHLWNDDGEEVVSAQGLVQISLEAPDKDGNITGNAMTYSGDITVTGTIDKENEVTLTLEYEDGFSTYCTGKYDPASDTITGSHEIDEVYYSETVLRPGTLQLTPKTASTDTLPSARPSAKHKHEETDPDESAWYYSSETEDDQSPSGQNDETNGQAAVEEVEVAEGSKPTLRVRVSTDLKKNSHSGDEEDAEPEQSGTTIGISDDLRTHSRMGSSSSQVHVVSPKSLNKTTRTFTFTRTPAVAWRFRYSPAHFANNPARARWRFACATILDDIQRRRLSWTWLAKRFHERGRFLELSVRKHLDRGGYTPREPLSTRETHELQLLKQNLYPTDAHFYYSLIPYIIDTRYTSHLGRLCTSCNRQILQEHLLCIRCISDDFKKSTDLCQSCIDKTPEHAGHVHCPSHSLIKMRRPLLDADLAWIIPKAREISDRVKELFRTRGKLIRELAINQKRIGVPVESTSSRRFKAGTTCGSCGIVTTIPCWVCLKCTPDTFICSDCESRNLGSSLDGPSPSHKSSHILLRISDTSLETVDPFESYNSRYTALEKRIGYLESRLNDQSDGSFKDLESRLKSIEKRFDKRLEDMEALLHLIATHMNPGSPGGQGKDSLLRPMGPRKPSLKPRPAS